MDEFCWYCRAGFTYRGQCRVCGWKPPRLSWVRDDLSPIDARVLGVAAKYDISPDALDWHLEAEHGWERHDLGYGGAAEGAAECLLRGGCE